MAAFVGRLHTKVRRVEDKGLAVLWLWAALNGEGAAGVGYAWARVWTRRWGRVPTPSTPFAVLFFLPQPPWRLMSIYTCISFNSVPNLLNFFHIEGSRNTEKGKDSRGRSAGEVMEVNRVQPGWHFEKPSFLSLANKELSSQTQLPSWDNFAFGTFDNVISGGLNILAEKCPNVTYLVLSGNKSKGLSTLEKSENSLKFGKPWFV